MLSALYERAVAVYVGLMAVVFSNNVIEIAVVQSAAGRPVVNVWHMYHDAEIGADTKQDVVEDFRNNWQDHMMDVQCEDVSIVSFDWRSLDPGDGSNGTVPPDPGKALIGAFLSEMAPVNTALLIHKNTANRPRGARDGRCYLAGVPEGDISADGTLSGAAQSTWLPPIQSFYSGISDITTFGGGDRYPVVLETTPESRAPGSASVTINSRRVTSLTLDAKVATQRERLR